MPGAAAALGRLAGDYRTVAVVSGRPVAFLREHLGGRGIVLSGLYGLERLRGTQVEEAEGAGEWRPVVAEVVTRARGPGGPGVDVEDKGLSVTLHFRNWPESAYHGVEGVRKFLAEWLEVWGEYEIDVEEILPTPDGRVVSLFAHHGKGHQSGVPMDLEMANIATLRGGRVIRIDNDDDRIEALEAAGLSE